MKIIFLCHGPVLDVYYDLYKSLKHDGKIKQAGFFISDRRYFAKFCSKNPEFNDECSYLGEWEISDKIDSDYSVDELKVFEGKYFENYPIWNALVADRRVYLGKLCKISHDHRPSFSHDKMQSLMFHGCQLIEDLFNSIEPEIIVGYSSATFSDHIFYAMSQSLKKKFVILRHTKVNNQMIFTEGLDEDFAEIRQKFIETGKCENNKDESTWIEAKRYLEKASEKKISYSGHRNFDISLGAVSKGFLKDFLRSVYVDLKNLLNKRDHHSSISTLRYYWYNKVIRIFRVISQEYFLAKDFLKLEDMDDIRFVFFPLHAEPEVSLSVLAKQYQNQIEVVRNLARQLPIDYKLVVKDHPRNYGRRSLRYLKKLMEIPNVEVVHPSINSIEIIRRCEQAIIISGYVGFEAILLRKPVITLGKTLLNILPSPIVTKVNNINDIWMTIQSNLTEYSYDEEVILNYLYSVMSKSVPIDLMTVLLRKENRKGTPYSDKAYKDNIQKLNENLSFFIEVESSQQ